MTLVTASVAIGWTVKRAAVQKANTRSPSTTRASAYTRAALPQCRRRLTAW